MTMADSDPAWERYRADIRGTKVIVDTQQEKPKLQFHIPIRPKAPKYRLGSGPPPPRPNLRLVHDSNAFIVDKVVLPHGPFHPDSASRQRRCYYIIGWPDLPAARPVVDASKILDYVSPRTLEDWEYQDALRREEEREKAKEAKEAEERALERGKAVAIPASGGLQPGAKRRPGRPPKSRMMVAGPPPEPELNIEQEEMIHKRMRGPSLSTPQKSRLQQLMAEEEEMLEELEGADENAETAMQRQLGILGESEGTSAANVNKRVARDLDELRLSSAVPGNGESSRASSARPAPANPARALATAAVGAALPKRPVSTTPIPLPSAFARMKNWTPKSQATSGASTTVLQLHIADSKGPAPIAHQSDKLYNQHSSSGDPPSHTNGFTPIGGTFPRPPKRPADALLSADVPAKTKPRKSKKKKQADLSLAVAEVPVEAASSPSLAMDLVQGEQDYVFKRLEGDYVLDGVHWFRVRWEGDWPEDENPTWEPRENIPEKLVKQYLKKKAKREADQHAKASAKKKPKTKQTNLLADQAKACSSVMEAFEGQADLDGTDHMDLDQGDGPDGNADAGDGPDELLVTDEDKELAVIERRKAMQAEFASQLAGMARTAHRHF